MIYGKLWISCHGYNRRLWRKKRSIIPLSCKALKRVEGYKTHFLIPMKGDKLLPVSVDMILFFYIADGKCKGGDDGRGKNTFFTQTLDELADSLDPALFFRINRQYLISRKAVQDIDLWFNGRLRSILIVPTLDRILG